MHNFLLQVKCFWSRPGLALSLQLTAVRRAIIGPTQAGRSLMFPPSCRQFFAGPNDTVLEQARNRTLPNFAKQLGDSEEGEAAKLCATELRCSRSLAAPRGETDRTGVVGCACGHTIPAKSLFLDMPTPEQHYFYDLVFKQVK